MSDGKLDTDGLASPRAPFASAPISPSAGRDCRNAILGLSKTCAKAHLFRPVSCRTAYMSQRCHNSSSSTALPPDSHGFAPLSRPHWKVLKMGLISPKESR